MSDASTDQTPTDATTQPADDESATAAAAVNGERDGQHAQNDNRRRAVIDAVDRCRTASQ